MSERPVPEDAEPNDDSSKRRAAVDAFFEAQRRRVAQMLEERVDRVRRVRSDTDSEANLEAEDDVETGAKVEADS